MSIEVTGQITKILKENKKVYVYDTNNELKHFCKMIGGTHISDYETINITKKWSQKEYIVIFDILFKNKINHKELKRLINGYMKKNNTFELVMNILEKKIETKDYYDFYKKDRKYYGLLNGDLFETKDLVVFNLPKLEIIKISLQLFSNHTLRKQDSFMLLN